jgi:hypothetical protein
MDKEIKDLLKKEILEVKQSKLRVIIGILLIIILTGLTIFNTINTNTLILLLPLIFIVWVQIQDYRINKAVLLLMRYILNDEEIIKKIDNLNDKNNNENKN